MGATCAIFPVDAETLRYLEFSGRPPERVELVEAYCREQGLFHDENFEDVTYSDTLELALDEVVPSLAGPKRPQDRVALTDAASDFRAELEEYTGHETPTGYDEALDESFPSSDPPTNNGGGESPKVGHSHPQQGTAVAEREEGFGHGSVVIAAITSCTNTSNPSVMIGAGLLAKKAVEAGLERMPWVKTSLAPGSKVVTEYLERAGLIEPLSKLGFDLVGYGCTTCIGNSGPLPEEVSKEIEERDLVVASVLSGNRNFEGRIHPEVKMNYLASPPLCVAYALAGRMDLDIVNEPLQNDVYLRDIWPTQQEVNDTIESAIESDMFRRSYGDALFEGDDNWKSLEIPEGDRYAWDDESTYVKQPPYFEDMPAEAPDGFEPIEGARVLALLGDSVTTDHISPAGAIKKDSPAGEYLIEHGVEPREFNSYGSRRGNHEVMMRGTFANIRLRNLLAPDTGGRLHEEGRRGQADLRRRGRVPRGRHAALRDRRQGVRLRLLARLGGEGSAAARRALRDRRVVRAHPPLEPGRHGHPAAPVPGRRERRVARPDGRGELRPRAARGRREDAQGQHLRGRGVRRPRAHRHAERVALLPPRRHPPLRAPRLVAALKAQYVGQPQRDQCVEPRSDRRGVGRC